LHFQAVGPDFGNGRASKGVLDVIETLFLVLPGVGLAYTAARVSRRGAAGAIKWSSGRPGRGVVIAMGGAAAVALAAFSWWPNGEYRPIQPGERGTLAGLIQQVDAIPTGRPSLTAQRQEQLGGAPTERARTARLTPQASQRGHAAPTGSGSGSATSTTSTRAGRTRSTPATTSTTTLTTPTTATTPSQAPTSTPSTAPAATTPAPTTAATTPTTSTSPATQTAP
jgi:hypothetical protein